ncbi:hypothetical protein RJT17_35805 [Streptomyces sp. P5-A9]|uniref:hypothetical protein n=1 Tax=Streptomyces sp. P5-A9 TaxID=3071730 RepID=UPI002FC8C69A
MTNPEELAGVDGADREPGDNGLAVRESVCVSEWLKSTRCVRCGRRILYAGDGRPPKYCRDSHRKRAAVVRTVQRPAARPVEEPGRTIEPVRDVVELTESRTSTEARHPSKGALPEDFREGQHALKQLGNWVRSGPGLAAARDDVLASDLEQAMCFVREHQQDAQQGEPSAVPRPRPQGSKAKRRKK